jgi:3-hydroxybutyryl-CoA dehydrogenase
MMIKKIAVLGAGTMGWGIAVLFGELGYSVSVFEPNEKARHDAALKLPSIEGDIILYADLEKAVDDADLIIEAVPEQLDIKRKIYNQLQRMIRNDAIVASNTSTFALQTLAMEQPFADRMVITHFFNPPQLIPLVEIVGLTSTAPQVLEKIVKLLRDCGKTPVVLQKDIPGFIANRLQAALMREACYLLEQGIADAEQIDAVVKEGLGLRYAFKGPFEIADLGGLDVWAKVTGHLFPELGTAVTPPESLLENVKDGALGIKSGTGYYKYDNPTESAEDFKRSLQELIDLKTKS